MSDQAYFVSPPGGPGPGVVVLTSWWGLTPFFRRFADRLSDLGLTVLVPDLAGGERPGDHDQARSWLAEADPNRLALLTLDSVRLLAEKTGGRPVSVVGFSMGASLGLWASVRLTDRVDKVVAFYGTQAIDFDGATARYQLHMVDGDEMVDDDELAFMEATMGLAGLEVETHRYPGAGHFFFESDQPGHDPVAAELAWKRLSVFLT